MKLAIPKTALFVVLSIGVNVLILTGFFLLIYVFDVKYPEHMQKLQDAREERRWLNSAVVDVKLPDGTIERQVRVRVPESMISNQTSQTKSPSTNNAAQSQSDHR